MTVDKRTNRLLLRDNKTALSTLEQWVSQMDLPVGQVELSAHIVTINEKSLRELGVKWTLADAQQAGGVGQVTTLGSDLSVATATTHIGFNIGRINGRLLDLELSALEQKQQLDIIASPRLLASHLQPASIKQGSEIPYQVSSGESGATSVEFKEAVLGMEVTSTVLQRSYPAEITHQPERSGRCYSRQMAKCWRLISRRSKRRSRSKAEKRWRWAAFLPVKINRVRIAYRCLATFPGSGNYFVMTEKKMNDAS